ncbi:BlaI/MecI/CopY family transcriptional regulator [Pseudidiomarina sp. PP-1MA]|uniref:BlaI/MecI/CopY family transcriptional regulator n=1 Tax=Pseudidiomarina sp. PP-1MA TaxID=3237706 RepID=A0AB39X8A4_9GAMM
MTEPVEISNAELVILNVLWQQAPLLSADIVLRVQQQEDWHEKTIKTLLNRLVKKGALSFEKDGRAYRYSPILAQRDYQQRAGSKLINNLFAGSVAGLVAGFAQQGQLSDQDVAQLKAIIAEWEQQEDSSC